VRTDDYGAAVSIVQEHLIEKLLTTGIDLRRVKAAAQMLHLEKGRFRLEDLAEQCNLSGRQLQRQFQETVGMSPKALARVIRFEAIRRRLMFNPDQSLTALAHEFEYSDQAHFTHDFKELAGRTP
jgi:AraC-like DNA-binding protein